MNVAEREKGRDTNMHSKTMEGLIGAGVNMKMVDVPIRVYKEARLKGDLGTMERAMGYAGDFTQKAYEYKDVADEGMKEDAEDARERAEEEQKESIEKRRAEQEKLQEKIEADKEVKKGEASADTSADSAVSGDSVEVSEEGRALSAGYEVTLPDIEPVIYTKTGEKSQIGETEGFKASV